MHEIDETDELIVNSLIDEWYRRIERRLNKWNRISFAIAMVFAAFSVAFAFRHQWLLWWSFLSIQIVSQIGVYRILRAKTYREENQWLEEHLPSWCRGITREQIEK